MEIPSYHRQHDESGVALLGRRRLRYGSIRSVMHSCGPPGNCTFTEMAVSHADRTIANHFRSNYSSFHVVDYNPMNGSVLGKLTWQVKGNIFCGILLNPQGYANWSSWARGQAWGLYGFTMMYRWTGEERFLTHARRIATFILSSPKVPSDGIPFWDYDVPADNETLRKVQFVVLLLINNNSIPYPA